MRFRPGYLVVAVVVFGLLALIETQLDGGFIRFTVGDALVVVLLYAIFMAFTPWSRTTSGVLTLGIAYVVEIAQALDVVNRLGVTPNRLTDVVLGTTFTWGDIAAYTWGMVMTVVVETLRDPRDLTRFKGRLKR